MVPLVEVQLIPELLRGTVHSSAPLAPSTPWTRIPYRARALGGGGGRLSA
jgi:hypothetical protein